MHSFSSLSGSTVPSPRAPAFLPHKSFQGPTGPPLLPNNSKRMPYSAIPNQTCLPPETCSLPVTPQLHHTLRNCHLVLPLPHRSHPPGYQDWLAAPQMSFESMSSSHSKAKAPALGLICDLLNHSNSFLIILGASSHQSWDAQPLRTEPGRVLNNGSLIY